MRLPDDTLYLPIKQVFFDAIIAGSKTVEHREVPGYPLASRYLIKSNGPNHYALNPDCTVPGIIYDWNDYNGGRYPFLPRPFKRLYMAVGYASDRDTAIVEIKAPPIKVFFFITSFFIFIIHFHTYLILLYFF